MLEPLPVSFPSRFGISPDLHPRAEAGFSDTSSTVVARWKAAERSGWPTPGAASRATDGPVPAREMACRATCVATSCHAATALRRVVLPPSGSLYAVAARPREDLDASPSAGEVKRGSL
jgi:hypothetical protein